MKITHQGYAREHVLVNQAHVRERIKSFQLTGEETSLKEKDVKATEEKGDPEHFRDYMELIHDPDQSSEEAKSGLASSLLRCAHLNYLTTMRTARAVMTLKRAI